MAAMKGLVWFWSAIAVTGAAGATALQVIGAPLPQLPATPVAETGATQAQATPPAVPEIPPVFASPSLLQHLASLPLPPLHHAAPPKVRHAVATQPKRPEPHHTVEPPRPEPPRQLAATPPQPADPGYWGTSGYWGPRFAPPPYRYTPPPAYAYTPQYDPYYRAY